MWVAKKRSWFETVVVGGAALPHIWIRTLLVTALSVIVTVVYEKVPAVHYSITATPFTLVGLSLGVFLGFRNNTAYDRFWEGRKLWGGLVNTSRSLARQVLTFFELQPDAAKEPDAAQKLRGFEERFIHLNIAFVHALKLHLRDRDPLPAIESILPASEVDPMRDDENVPLAILQRMGDLLAEARRNRWIDAFHAPVVESSLVALTDIQGACERIKSTPIPYSYTVLMHRIVAAYCTLLPFGLMDTIRWATPFVVLAVSYCFFGLDSVGDEIEQPFGLDTNDLPLDGIARTIERNLRRRLGEPLPPPVKPKGGVLS